MMHAYDVMKKQPERDAIAAQMAEYESRCRVVTVPVVSREVLDSLPSYGERISAEAMAAKRSRGGRNGNVSKVAASDK